MICLFAAVARANDPNLVHDSTAAMSLILVQAKLFRIAANAYFLAAPLKNELT